jgi:hypothetical protein
LALLSKSPLRCADDPQFKHQSQIAKPKRASRSERLRAKGLLTARQIAELIGSKPLLVDYWREVGLLNGIRLNDKNEYLYEHPNADAIQQIKRRIKLRKSTTYPG